MTKFLKASQNKKLSGRLLNSVLTKTILSASLSLALVPAVYAADVFINEIHYDNAGGDVNEGVEVAGPAGTDLTGWSLHFYNGSSSSGKVYKTESLVGVVPNQQDGFGTVSFAVSGLQNGSPDGIALIDADDNVIQFISYEGTFTAIGGPADGMSSIDITWAENSSTPVGHSLQLAGEGSKLSDYSWQAENVSSFGQVNTNQVFGSGGTGDDLAPSVINTSPGDNTGVIALNTSITISFSESVEVTDAWFDINCTNSGHHSAVVTDGPQHFTLSPEVEFSYNESCSVDIFANKVNDLDENDPQGADYMQSDVSFSFNTLVNSPIVINEVDADTKGSDTLEFIELYDGGLGNTSLDGLVVVLYNGSDSQSYNTAFSLNGFTTNNEGFFVLGNDAVLPKPALVINNNSLQNGADAVAIYLASAEDFPNDTPVTGKSLIDAVVYDTSDSDAQTLINTLTPEQAQINEHGAGNKDGHSISRVPDGGKAIITTNYLAQTSTPGVSNVALAEIYDIQGAGDTSPFADQYVASNNNIVTALASRGFFMQTPAISSDNNIETSDGIYVYTGSTPSVSVGDSVNIIGKVVEYNNFTEYAYGSQITVNSSNNPVPAVITFDESMPAKVQPQSANEFERFESMIVSFDGVVTGASDKYGDASVVAGSTRAFREPGITFPGEAGFPIFDGNPEIFEIAPDGLGGDNVDLFAGQTLSATGPLGFSYGDYQVWPTSLTLGEAPELLNGVRQKVAGEMTVGSLNMYRPSQIASKYDVRLTKISQFVREEMHAPDILAVSEVETLAVLQAIADKIYADDNSISYSPYLIEGNDVGGIDVGFLTRNTVEMDEVIQYGKDLVFDYGYKTGSLNDRPPLLFKGRVIANGSNFPIQVLVVHNRSLSGIDSKEYVPRKRLEQAQFVASIVQDIQAADSDVNLVVTGDFNAYQFSDGYVDVLGQITGTAVEEGSMLWEPSPVTPVLTNQVNLIDALQQYSFVYQGSAQVLDHALTTQNLNSLVTEFSFARGNSDAPANLVNNDINAMRASDHDGIVLFITMDSDNDTISDNLDVCADTLIPEALPSKGLKPFHFALLDNDINFDSYIKGLGKTPANKNYRNSNNLAFSLVDTKGCSCQQIVEQQGLGKGHLKHGCSFGVMKTWLNKVNKTVK